MDWVSKHIDQTLCLNAAAGGRNGVACVSPAWGWSLQRKGLQFLNTEGEKVTHFPGWFSFPSQPPDYFSVLVAVRLQLIRLLERAAMAKKCAWGGILLWNLQVMHYLLIGAALHRQTDAKTVLDVENIQHLPQFWRDCVFFFFLVTRAGYQTFVFFFINMRSFCISSSAQLSSRIRTAKKNNPGNFIFHNISALADLVESQQWATSNDIWSEKCLPSLPSLSAHCTGSQPILRSQVVLPACLPIPLWPDKQRITISEEVLPIYSITFRSELPMR